MKLKIYQIDAFTQKVFSGNPAAVCPLEEWLSDDTMLKIAAENNLAETAFYIKRDDTYHLRWFTPKVEVDLCGHATLATAFVLFEYENHQTNHIKFYSPRSGYLHVHKEAEFLMLDFPAEIAPAILLTPEIITCFNIRPIQAFKGKSKLMLVFNNQKEIQNLKPVFENILKLDSRGVIATAVGEDSDFVSRYFAPQVGILEDHVTGSAHTLLIPFWAQKLNKQNLSAIQMSERMGFLKCSLMNDRVLIGGQAMVYLTGNIYI